MLVLLIVILLIFIILSVFQTFNYWNKKGVITANILYCFSNYSQNVIRLNKTGDVFKSIYNEHRDKRYVGFYNFVYPVLLVFDSDLIKKILIEDFQSFCDHTKQVSDDIDEFWSKNIHSLTYAEGWKNLRMSMAPFFTNGKMRLMFPVMQQSSNEFLSYIKSININDVIEMKEAFMRYSHDIIASTGFGFRADSFNDKNNDIWLIGKNLASLSPLNLIGLILYTLFPFAVKLVNLKIVPEKACLRIKTLIQESIRLRQEQNVTRPDLIHFLNKARFEKFKIPLDNISSSSSGLIEITDNVITAQVAAFFFAAIDTVSSSLTNICYELAENPDIQEKVCIEINENIQNEVTFDGLQSLKYMNSVILESTRKHPASSIIDRNTVKPYYIKAEKPGERDLYIPKDVKIWIPYHSFQMDPMYFPNPEKFDPDRFSNENIDKVPPFRYFPFGAGPRKCIGERLALLEVKLLLVKLLQNYEVVTTGKTIDPPCSDNLDQVFFGLKPKT